MTPRETTTALERSSPSGLPASSGSRPRQGWCLCLDDDV